MERGIAKSAYKGAFDSDVESRRTRSRSKDGKDKNLKALGRFSPSLVFNIYWSRAFAVVILLVLQSGSSIILNRYTEMLHKHTEILLFQTMLIGAGGNAGNQCAVDCIVGINTGKYSRKGAVRNLINTELAAGLLLSLTIASVGFVRLLVSGTQYAVVAALSLSLFLIVLSSTIIGTVLPLTLTLVGLKSEHAGPAIQVVMDIVGVMITCVICDFILA